MGGRTIGLLAATLTVIVLVFVWLGLFTSGYGVLIAGAIAALVGVGAGVVAEPRRAGQVTAVVVGYVIILIVAYLMLTVFRYAPPGSQGGPTVMPPT